jgi:hypothetical protein
MALVLTVRRQTLAGLVITGFSGYDFGNVSGTGCLQNCQVALGIDRLVDAADHISGSPWASGTSLKTRQWSGQKSSRSRHAGLQSAVFSPVAAHGNRQVFCPTVEVAQHRVLDAHALEVVN